MFSRFRRVALYSVGVAGVSTASATSDGGKKRTNVVIIGAGWAGIGTAAALSENKVDDYIVLEKGDKIGYFWSRLYDSIRMNTFRHRLWNSPPQLDPPNSGDYLTRDEVVEYLDSYSQYHNVTPKIQFNTEVCNVSYNEESQTWIVETGDNQTIESDYLTIATSINRLPYRADWPNRDTYNGVLLHTNEYMNASDLKSKVDTSTTSSSSPLRVLVVGCGNSAVEIAGELAAETSDFDVTMLVSGEGRHWCTDKKKHRFEKFFHRFAKPSPFSEESLMSDNLISCKDINFHRDIIQFDSFTNWLVFEDLSAFGIPKPKLSPLADHYYNKKLAVVDRITLPLIKSGQLKIENQKIDDFTGDGVRFADDSSAEFDIIILGTGFRHGLEKLFGDELWDGLSTTEYDLDMAVLEKMSTMDSKRRWIGLSKDWSDLKDDLDTNPGAVAKAAANGIVLPKERRYRWPATNGRSRSVQFPNLYFAGFDQGYLGGLTIGIYSWAIGEEIAEKMGAIQFRDRQVPWSD